MTVYSYDLTQSEVLDFNVKYRKSASRKMLIPTVVLFVLSALFLGLTFAKELVNPIITAFGFAMFLTLGVFCALFMFGTRNGAKLQSEVYFKECNVNGVISYSIELLDNEYVASQPARGNVHHYLYDSIVKVVELDGFVAVVMSNNQCLPVLRNETTEPLIAFFKSRVVKK